jgi:hypothetical protein
MEKVEFIEIQAMGVKQTYAIIDRGNGEFTSMLKSTYDEQQAELAIGKAPKVVDEATPV